MPMYILFYLWHNHKLFLYYILTIYILSTFLHIMFMYMYMYNMNQFEINHSFNHSFIRNVPMYTCIQRTTTKCTLYINIW